MLRAQIYWRAGRWMESSRALARLTGYLRNAFSDGRLNDRERGQLVKLLEEFGG